MKSVTPRFLVLDQGPRLSPEAALAVTTDPWKNCHIEILNSNSSVWHLSSGAVAHVMQCMACSAFCRTLNSLRSSVRPSTYRPSVSESLVRARSNTTPGAWSHLTSSRRMGIKESMPAARSSPRRRSIPALTVSGSASRTWTVAAGSFLSRWNHAAAVSAKWGYPRSSGHHPHGLELNHLYNCQNNHFIIMGLTFCCGAINNRSIQVKITAVQLHCEID